MPTDTKALTQQKYDEAWAYIHEVNLGKESFILNEKEFEILKKAMTSGMRGLVFFDNFSISLAHIQWTKTKHKIVNGKAYEEWIKLSDQVEKEKQLGQGQK